MDARNQGAGGRANCQRCAHYYVTYDMTRPHGCRQFGFTSQRVPSLEVLAASGKACEAFEQRPTPKPGHGGGGSKR